jgi:hypothetical protein
MPPTIRTGESGSAGNAFPLPGVGPVTAVDHRHPAGFAKTVFCRNPAQTSLKRVVQAGNFVPAPKVPFQGKALHRLNPFGDPGAATGKDTEHHGQVFRYPYHTLSSGKADRFLSANAGWRLQPPVAVGCVIRTILVPCGALLFGARCAPYNELLVEAP